MIRPNYKYAETAAHSLLKDFNITSLPVYMQEITKSYKNLKIRTYTWFSQKNNISIEDTIEYANSDSGCCYYMVKKHQYIILYNNTINNQGHIRWTIAHELGHYIMKHNEKSKKANLARNSITDDEYNIYEKEANCFARTLLAPPHIIAAINKIEPYEIETICNVSYTAAFNICEFLSHGRNMGIKYSSSFYIVLQFNDFIHRKTCKQCNNYFIGAWAKYCPVCGSNAIKWGKGEKAMIYDKFDLDENSKAKVCPHCENEEIDPAFDICKICGTNLINKCAGTIKEKDCDGEIHYDREPCSFLSEGNARVCLNCGSPTTYAQDGILEHWQKEYNKKMGITEDEENDDIPF